VNLYVTDATFICKFRAAFSAQLLLVVSSRRKAAAAAPQSKMGGTQLEFNESMKRTQNAVARSGCLSRWWCRADTEEKYAVDILATEIDSLQRTVEEVAFIAAFIHIRLLKQNTSYFIFCHTILHHI